MNTTPNHSASSDPLPEVHLIVAPVGQEAVFEHLLATAAPSSILAWRVAASCARLLTDTDLDAVMTSALQKGHPVVVWHGQDGWSPYSLRLRLGKDAVNLSRQLSWARLELPTKASSSHVWTQLLKQLNTPDEADLRRFIQSHGRAWPRWNLPEPLNEQGIFAFQAWTEQHLSAVLDDFGEGQESGEAGASGSEEVGPADWPWQDSVTWVAEQWLASGQVERIGRFDEPANEDDVRVRAAPMRLDAAGREAVSAILHPVSTDDQWESEQLVSRSTSLRPSAANTASVTISRPADDHEAPYAVNISPPRASGSQDKPVNWCLWFHFHDRLPLALPFVHHAGSDEVQLSWSDVTPGSSASEPSESLWQAIRGGGVSLEML